LSGGVIVVENCFTLSSTEQERNTQEQRLLGENVKSQRRSLLHGKKKQTYRLLTQFICSKKDENCIGGRKAVGSVPYVEAEPNDEKQLGKQSSNREARVLSE